MGLLDTVFGLFGDGDESPEPSTNPEILFELTGAAMTMEEDLGYAPTGHAALCFSAPDADHFETTLDDLEAVLDASEADVGTRSRFLEDGHGFRWIVIEDDVVEDLVTTLRFASETLVERNYDEHLLAALISFERRDRRAYWLYSFDRGTFYPFVPDGDRERDTATEFRLRSVLDPALPVEQDESEWYPLWPDRPGQHPWE